mgnify:CR=1 FL=1
MIFRKKRRAAAAAAVQTAPRESPFSELSRMVPLCAAERRLYEALRSSVPVVDAAIGKILRLTGTFRPVCADRTAGRELERFLRSVRVGAAGSGVQTFLDGYLSDLLTYGNAVGEMVVQGGEFRALYNAPLDGVELRAVSPLEIQVLRRENGKSVPVRYPQLVFCSALNPPSGSAEGVSLLHGLPFAADILLRIFHAVGKNWDRVGNVRFAVSYLPGSDEVDQANAKERAEQIAGEWGRAMRGDGVSDFISVGDVRIQAVGSDCQILDSEVPVRQLLEQIVAKLGVPPFLLGLSWSSTERMSSQQADILTSELEAYRRLLTPPAEKICALWLKLAGYAPEVAIDWDDITLQDAVQLATARYQNARAAEIEAGLARANRKGE